MMWRWTIERCFREMPQINTTRKPIRTAYHTMLGAGFYGFQVSLVTEGDPHSPFRVIGYHNECTYTDEGKTLQGACNRAAAKLWKAYLAEKAYWKEHDSYVE